MSGKDKLVVTYEPEKAIEPFYTGGDIALSADGAILASCLGEEAIVTNIQNGRILARIEGDGEVLTSLALTSDATHLIICSRSLSMRIYRLQGRDDDDSLHPVLTRTVKAHSSPVVAIAVDESGTFVGTGGADGLVKVWSIADGALTHNFRGHTGVISALHFFHVTGPGADVRVSKQKRQSSRPEVLASESKTNSGNLDDTYRLASGGEDGKIRIWNMQSSKAIATLDSHVSVIRGLDFCSSNQTLISAARDQTVVLWDSKTWKLIKIIAVLEVVEAAGFLDAGRMFYVGGERGSIRLWDTQTSREISTEQTGTLLSDTIIHIIHNPTQGLLLAVHSNQSLVFHDCRAQQSAQGTHSADASLPVIRQLSGTHDEIIDLAFVSSDRSLLALATNTESIQLVSVGGSRLSDDHTGLSNADYFGADVYALEGHTDIVICLAVDDSGHWLATGAKDNTARVWRIDRTQDTYELYATFTGHAESIGAVCFPRTGESSLAKPPPFLLTGSQDRTIKKWTISQEPASSSKSLYTRKAHDKDINAIAISPSSNLFASASQDRLIKIWSTEEGETQGVLRGHKRGIWTVVFAPKDAPPLSNDEGRSTASNRGLILTGSGDKTIKIWSLNSYTCVRTLEGHADSVLKVIWLPPPAPAVAQADNEAPVRRPEPRIASSGADGLVKIWNPITSLPLATLDNHTDRVWALALNPDTDLLVSGAADGVVTFWKDTTQMTASANSKAMTERIEQDQELQNCAREGRYREAITLALQLNHPARLLGLFQSAIDAHPTESGSISGVLAVDEVLRNLSDEQLLLLLMRVRDWNTNARTSPVAQRVLNIVVKHYAPDRLAKLGKRKGGKEVVEALKAYTERHYNRIEELWEESFVVEFLLGEMDQLGVRDTLGSAVRNHDIDVVMV